MIKATLQLINGVLYPFSKEDQNRLNEFHDNQIVNANLKGIEKPRSYEQLKLYWKCCQVVADNTEDQEWNTKERVDFICRVRCRFADYYTINKVPHVKVKSISYANLKHIEACGYINDAFEVMARKLGITKDELTTNAEAG